MTSETATVRIDVPRWSFVKRKDDGSVDFVSPLPSPFNYGHVTGTHAADGEAVDVVVLGERLTRGTCRPFVIRGKVAFLDAGVDDPKWICASTPLSAADRRKVERFFRRYAVAKRLINRFRGRSGPTRFLGWI